ncbi:MAG TPA: hypothetical protein VKU41_01470 [Polyangiaceae bacterium]|nr:hypothetical protein [Polyangiaceae bacterium]
MTDRAVAGLVVAWIAGAACSRGDAAPKPAAGNAVVQSANSPAAGPTPPLGGAGPRPTRAITLTLAKLPVEVALPSGWSILEGQSDRETGLVALGPTADDPWAVTAFLDASQIVRVPPSAPEATAAALARDACAKPGDCTVLGSESIPGGYLVSLRTPHAVAVESWRTAPLDHALRCGFEASDFDPRSGRASTWLYDPDAVARARRQGEELCRSARPIP